AELYYWFFVLLTSIPFVLICFLLIRFVAPLSFKDVLHLSFYPIGAAVFAGAAFALVTAAVVALLVAVGYIPQIKHDFTNWWDPNEVLASPENVRYGSLADTRAQIGNVRFALKSGHAESPHQCLLSAISRHSLR